MGMSVTSGRKSFRDTCQTTLQHSMKIILTLFISFFSALLPLSAQEPDLEDINTDAYLSMLDADKRMEEEKPQEALPLYQQALEAYKELNRRDPGFKTKIVSYRMDILTEKVESLTQSMPNQPAGPARAESDTEVPTEDNYEALYLETREKMARDAARLLELEKRNIEMVVTLRESQETLTRQEEQIRELRKQVEASETEQKRAAAGLEKEVRDLTRFNTLLQERADRLEGATQGLTAERDELRATVAERNRQLAELEDSHGEIQKELSLQKLNATQGEQRLILARNQLRDDLEAAKRELEEARTRLKAAEEKSAGVALLEETVIELNRRNETQTAQLRETRGEMERLQVELEKIQHERDQAIEKLTEVREEVKSTREVTQNLRRAESELAAVQKEAAKLKLNFQQEHEVRKQLQATVEQQFKSLSDRMNEIIGLRRDLAILKESAPASDPDAEETAGED